ncbi:5'/3'-nucleotidase SurE [Ostreibacterium oceani]|uniref:5'-nucleotidase SurE n=1 Tax=Ostreibacterium oceani TaxID=2654998 RepID=A0A6N7EXN3_9GAMM|nr:5'/3'-nucleotidase SurE [Ostreibacterium oceani]MPV85228.1 5'/3'-nucleotidase SurE [Ostreibacterium oceani]
MKALLSNDDGYLSPGLKALYDIVSTHCSHIDVVAPDRNCSGVSSALTLRHPLYTHQHENGFISVEGTPTDCVHIALLGLLDTAFDIVISGINLGANLGDDVVYSGTVAAAIEGRFLGYPSLAVSMTSPQPVHYETAAYVLNQLIPKLHQNPLPNHLILNINIPDIPVAELKGIRATRLSFRHQAKPVKQVTTKHGQTAYWIGEPGEMADQRLGTDFHAIQNGYASVTPIHTDLTHHRLLTSIDDWLG